MEEDPTVEVEDKKNPSEHETINFESDSTTTDHVEEINLDVENTFEKEAEVPPEEKKSVASSSLKEEPQPEPAETTFDKEVEPPPLEEMQPVASSSIKEPTAETTLDQDSEPPSQEPSSSINDVPAETTVEVQPPSFDETQPVASSSQNEIPVETTSDEEGSVTSFEDIRMKEIPGESISIYDDQTVERPSVDDDTEPLQLTTMQEVDINPFVEGEVGEGGGEEVGEGVEGEGEGVGEGAGEGEGEGEEPDLIEFKPGFTSSLTDIKEGEGKKVSFDMMEDISMIKYSNPELPVDAIRKSINQQRDHQMEIFGQTMYDTLPTLYDSSSSSEFFMEIVEGGEEEEGESEAVSIFAELGLGLKRKEPINRKELEEELVQLRECNKFLKRRNGLLHKRIKQYYVKRKITTVFDDDSEELTEKYEAKLDDLCELRNKTQREKQAIDNELKDMILLRNEQHEELIMNFNEMQDREFEVGHGLIDLRTGKVIQDKTIEKLLKRQKIKWAEIAEIRLAYIKKRNIVKEMEQEIKKLETIGGSLNLMDIEQLRMENQTYLEKIEEREEEVMRLRDRYSKDIVQVGHMREKLNIIEVEIVDMKDERESEIERISQTRKELNDLKIQRDKNRSKHDILKQSTGLLNYPKMLFDMDSSLKVIQRLEATLAKLKEIHEVDRIRLINIRAHLKSPVQQESKIHVKLQKRISSSIIKKNKKGRGRIRPTLAYDMTSTIIYFRNKMNKMKKNSKS